MLLLVSAVLIAIVTGVFLAIYYHFKSEYSYWRKKGVEYLTPSFPFGNLGGIFSGKYGMDNCIQDLYQRTQGSFTGIYFIKSPAILIKDPELIKHVLVKDFHAFMDRGVYMNEKKEPTSGHLFRLSGQRWKNMRMKLTPAFTAGKLKMMFDTITNVALELSSHLLSSAEDDVLIDIGDLTTRFSADIIASTIYGIEINSFADKSNEFIVMAKDLFVSTSYVGIFKATLQSFFPAILPWLPMTMTVKTMQEQFIHRLVKDVVAQREDKQIVRKDMMQLLIQLKNNGKRSSGELIEDEEEVDLKRCGITLNDISAQAYTFFFAGFETISSTMSFLLYECALDPKLQTNLRSNIEETLKNHNGLITYESIGEMDYLHRTVNETLRKYPILPFLNRIATEDYALPHTNLVLKKGTRLIISVSGLHYDPRHYPDPCKFDPDRFKRENCRDRHAFAYLPFGEGPRNCIGKRMGQMVVAVGVATIIRNFVVEICTATQVPLQFNQLAYLTQTTSPIMLKLTKRQHQI